VVWHPKKGILDLTGGNGSMASQFWHRRQFPLQMVLVVPFLLQISVAVGLTGWLSWRNGQEAVTDLAQQLMNRTGEQVSQKLDSYLSIPVRINALNQLSLKEGLIDSHDSDQIRRLFWTESITTPQISYIDFTTPDNQYRGVGRWRVDRSLEFSERLAGPNQTYNTYRFGGNSDRGVRGFEDSYDPWNTPWLQSALQKKKQVWNLTIEESTDPSNPYYIGMTLATPVYDRTQKLLGVFSSDLALPHISRELNAIKPSPNSHIVVADRQKHLIGTSTTDPLITLSPRPGQKPKPEKTTLDTSQNLLFRQIDRAIESQLKGFQSVQIQQLLSFDFEGQRQYLLVKPWKDSYGIDWLVAIVVPESDFMAQIQRNVQQTWLLCGLALACATGLGLWTSRWIATPILQLRRTTQSIAAGELDRSSVSLAESAQSAWQIREVGDLSESLGEMVRQLQDSFTALDHRASHDSLTGLLNRGGFRDRLQSHLEHVSRVQNAAGYAVLFLDLDYFKLVNDSLGHLVGDQLLMEVADRLRSELRSADILARLGGDEFVILLPATDADLVTQIADRLIKNLKESYFIQGNELFINSSIGIVLGSATADADELLRSADVALYRAKNSGRGCYELFDHRMHADVVDRLQLETDLRHAIDRGEMRVYYQPIVDTQTQSILGFESLLRWQHPIRGMISPLEFIPIAEETGLIIALGDWVLVQSCTQLKTWNRTFDLLEPDALMVSVNVSSKQFLLPDFVSRVSQILQDQDIPSRCLKLEITETLLMQHEGPVLLKLQQLQSLGVQLSIDDFGTGYSSLSYLYRFPISTLKIDRSFINQMDQDPKTLMVVEAIVDLSRRMGMSVVAEGVETQTQLNRLQSLNCQMAQGFLFAKPLDVSSATTLLESQLAVTNEEQPIALTALFNAVTRG
jgi:diguanylate cyclase (GGDEF)-like protein